MDSVEDFFSVIQGISAKLRELKEREIKNLDSDDFTFTDFRYIEAIDMLGRPTLIELSRNMSLSKPTVTVAVGKLVEGGYARKVRSADDGRVFHVELTSRSREILAAHAGMFRKFSEEVSGKFSEKEMKVLIALLKRI